MTFTQTHDFSSCSDAVVALSFSLGGAYLASAGYHGATIYDLEQDDIVPSPFTATHTSSVSALAWLRFNDSMAVDILILGTVNGGLMSWRSSDSKPFAEVDSHMTYDGSEILSITTRQRESRPTWRIATGSRGGTVQVWEVDRLGKMTNVFSKQVKEMIAKTLAYNPSDGGLLVFTLANSAILHLREDTGEMQGVIELRSCVMAAASFDSNIQIFAIHNVYDGFDIYDFNPIKRTRCLKTGISRNHYPKQVAFLNHAQRVVGGTENGMAKIFNIETGTCEQNLCLRGNLLVHTVATLDLPMKTLVAVASADVGFDNTIGVWQEFAHSKSAGSSVDDTTACNPPQARRRSKEPSTAAGRGLEQSDVSKPIPNQRPNYSLVASLIAMAFLLLVFLGDPHSSKPLDMPSEPLVHSQEQFERPAVAPDMVAQPQDQAVIELTQSM